MKIADLEQRMNEKNRILHDAIINSVNQALSQHQPSYASALGGCTPKVPVISVNSVPGGPPHPTQGPNVSGVSQSDGHFKRPTGQPIRNQGRGRSPSVKRLRDNDGLPVDRTERSNSRPPQKPCVVGTSNNAVQTQRKMRSPPADIFVWGVHPNTTPQDIVEALAESGILIQVEDVEKKSREEAYLLSYRIRLKAEDLHKAPSSVASKS